MIRSAPVRTIFVAFAVTVLVAAVAAGQTTGQIEGIVLDTAGTALPGVTVETTSPALQGTKVALTDEAGRFRLVFLPSGSYAVRCALSGFATVDRDGIVVPLGRTVSLQVQMQPAFHEQVTVTSAPPAVDVRSAELGANVDRHFFLSLPFERDFTSIMQAAPGTSTDNSGTVVYGSTGLENTSYIDGVNTTGTLMNAPARLLNFEFIGEVQVRTGGYAAEYGRSTGGVINVVTRSGGNEFHGDVFGYYFSDALQSRPRDEVEAYRREYGGSYTIDAFRKADLGFDLGGYLLKDGLWFFAAYDRVASDDDFRIAKDFTGYGGPAEGTIYVSESVRQLWSGKLTWRPAANHSLIASAFGDPVRLEGPINDPAGEESTFLGVWDQGGFDSMIRYEGVLGTSVVVDAQASRFDRPYATSGPGSELPLVVDFTTPLYAATGVPTRSGGFGSYTDAAALREGGRINVAAFVGDLAGDHEFKAGIERERVTYGSEAYRTGGQTVHIRCARGHLTDEGCPSEWVYYGHGLLLTSIPPGGVLDPGFASFVTSVEARDRRSVNDAVYVQDSWRSLSSLTLNLGLRWERQRFYDPHGALKLTLDDEWAPRIGFAWDVRGDGKAKLFGSWGRFYETAPLALSLAFDDAASAWTYNRDRERVECDPDLQGDRAYLQCSVLANSPTPIDPAGVRGGFLDETILGGEFTVARDLVLGAKLVYRSLGRIVEDAATVDGFRLGNPGYGLLEAAPDFASETWLLPVPRPKRVFKGVELIAIKRMSSNWQLMASYLWSRLEGNYDGSYYPDFDQWMPNVSAAYDYGEFPVHNDGYLSNDRRHQAKVFVTYVFPFGLTAGASAYYRSGAPVSAIGWIPYYGNVLYLSKRGAWARTDAEYETDLHLDYPIRVGGAEVRILLDVFNALDRQGETARDQSYNLDWTVDVIDYSTGEELPPIAPGTPCTSVVPPDWAYSCNPGFNTTNAWQDPRSVRLGVRLTF